MPRLTIIIAAAAALGVGIAGVAESADSITIGFTVSQTGSLNVDSLDQLHGFELWRDAVNAAGGIKAGGKSYQIKFVNYDDQSKGDRVQQLYTKLITEDNADFLFSPYSSGLTATASIISEQYEKVMLTTGAAEQKTYTLGNKGLFQLYTPADQYLAGAVALVKQIDPTAKVAMIYSDDAFSKAVAIAARDQAAKAGLALVLDEAYAPDTADFGPIINKIVSAKADVVIGGGHYADGSTLARQLHDQKAPVKFVALLVAPDTPKFATLGDAALGICVPSQWEASVGFKPDFGPDSATFTKDYKAKYNADPSYQSAGGYATGLILANAIEKAGSTDSAKVAAALNATDATTFFGHTKFSTDPANHGLELGHDMVLAQWQKKDGALVKETVWPKAAQTAPLLYPIP